MTAGVVFPSCPCCQLAELYLAQHCSTKQTGCQYYSAINKGFHCQGINKGFHCQGINKGFHCQGINKGFHCQGINKGFHCQGIESRAVLGRAGAPCL